jgi:uncharacterized protein
MPHPIFNFEWNATKAAANLKNHSVDFDEAATAFEDPFALVVDDHEHSQDEPRRILIGYSDHRRLLFVSFVHRADDLIRIISARRAGAQELDDYEKNNRFIEN